MTRTETQFLISRAIERLQALGGRDDREDARREANGILWGLLGRMGVWRYDEVYLERALIDAYVEACTGCAPCLPSEDRRGGALHTLAGDRRSGSRLGSPAGEGDECAKPISCEDRDPGAVAAGAGGPAATPRLTWWLAILVLGLQVMGAAEARAGDEMSPFVRALRLVQLNGTEEALRPENDAHTKAVLGKALDQEGALLVKAAGGLFDSETLVRLGGEDGRLDPTEVARAVKTAIPASRTRLYPQVLAHLDELATSLDRIDQSKREAAATLAAWVAEHYEAEAPLGIMLVCTGNSRRSMLGATMGNAAAAYWGLPQVRFSSGGTEISACNERTVHALRDAGFRVEPTGKEAKRGEKQAPNPIYEMRWGEPREGDSLVLQTTEFSKLFSEPPNPRHGFAALMVCSDADASCPFVPGALLRLSVPYLDPKLFDGSRYEAAKYAERRDDEGRLMLSSLMLARQHLKAAGKLP